MCSDFHTKDLPLNVREKLKELVLWGERILGGR